MLSPSLVSPDVDQRSLPHYPRRGSKPVINIEIPSVTFNDVVVNQNGSLHMNTPTGTHRDGQKRTSGGSFSEKSKKISSSIARSESLAMSSFVQTASGRKYIGNYEEETNKTSSYTPSTESVMDIIYSEGSDAVSDARGSGLSDMSVEMGPCGLGTPTSLKSQSPPNRYYGGVVLIPRQDPTPLRIAPLGPDNPSSARSSPPFPSSHSGDSFMGRHGYDVPVSATPGTDTDSARSKVSKQSANGGGSGFRGGLKSVKETIRGIGGGSNGNVIRKKNTSPSHPGNPTSNNHSLAPRQQQQQQQLGALDISAGANHDWFHNMYGGSGRNSNGTLSPPPSSATERFDIARRPSNSSAPSQMQLHPPPQQQQQHPAGGITRIASPFSYVKFSGSQPRLPLPSPIATSQSTVPGLPHPHDPTLGHAGVSSTGSGSSTPTARPSFSFASVRTFGQPAPAPSSSSTAGLAPPPSPFARSLAGGHIAGVKSVDVAQPPRGTTRWPNTRRSRSIDGLSRGEY